MRRKPPAKGTTTATEKPKRRAATARRKVSERREKRAPPGESISEQIDRDLVRSALAKRQTGAVPSKRETEALRRWENDKEERQRWQHYATIPQKHWREMSGRQARTINEQAKTYGIPFDGATIDLPAVVRAMHDLFAKHARKFAAPEGEEDGMFGPSTPWLEKYRKERALLARLERKEREGELLPREKVHEFVTELATILRGASDRLERRFGDEALVIINEALDSYDKWAERCLPGVGEIVEDGDGVEGDGPYVR